ncbi:septal ring lytic transglycosylase RlpA family protein [Lysobacter sp. TY2-98]|uniref:septal ring lytic transglycosylase RlpA family protein n=1 Tax=Lysobacter sp. TY2-98 TaxID=2290922 RepID=UPI000E20376B|nr:septal ring lytic transglycosylase RlpA family protein [Lysobacter sp. TY2-98]AXK72944.1 septal ring lytic transglycosylase RlpA family protein [Lysobacter sp. TY2-98]
MKKLVVVLLCAGLAACASAPPPKPAASSAAIVHAPSPVGHDCSWYQPAEEDLSKRGDYVAGGLYRPDEKDRVPGAIPDIDCIPEPQVVALPRSKLGNKPVYSVLDREYRVLDDTHGFVEEGLASYYGEKFHGRRTSNWEVYDMYAFSAAHKTLPIPSFARVTNLVNGRSVVVRVNDRGPFHEGRVMDLSLAAAVKLGIYPAGTGRVRVEALQPGDTATGTTFASTTTSPIAPSLPPPTPTALDVATRDYRYATSTTGTAADSQRFDAWMKERGIHVATGKPTVIASTDAKTGGRTAAASVSTPAAPRDAAPSIDSPAVTPPVATAPAPIKPAPALDTADAITLQVASFSTRDNADRALAALRGAGIADARLFDAVAKGQPIWRLRVGPLPASAEAELAARLRGLGFAAQRVHD